MTPKHTELPENHQSIIELAHWANGGVEYDVRSCECDHESNQYPCRYCAIHTGLNVAIKLYNQHAELIRQRDELAGALQRLLRAFESDTEQVPHLDVKTCWQTNSAAIEQARQALTPTK